MIYIIGGAPRCGKTILAKRIALKKKIPLLLTDAIRPVILSYLPKSELKTKMSFTAMKGSECCSSEESLRAEIIEAKTMWPGIKALIHQLSLCKQNYVIEGVHLLPELVWQLKKEKYWKNIKIVFLIKNDLDKIVAGLTKNKDEFDWLQSCLSDKNKLCHIAEMVKLKSSYIEKQTKKYRFTVVNTDTAFKEVIKKTSARI